MGTRFCVTMLISIFLFQTGCTNNSQSVESGTPVSSEESLTSNEKAPQDIGPFIIDVRTQEEWDAGHLENAIFIPHEQLPDKIAGVTENKSAKLVLY